jgi:hypothetical protein
MDGEVQVQQGRDPKEIPTPRRHLIVGDTPEARRTCAALIARGDEVVHLRSPSDSDLAEVLDQRVSSLAVLLHSDTQALRYCLSAEHLRPGLPMFVALFDKTAADQLVAVVPNCRVMSPADVALPSLVAACLSDELVGATRDGERWMAHPRSGGAPFPLHLSRRQRMDARVGIALGQLRPHDSGSRILLAGAVGILLILGVDTVLGLSVLHESAVAAFQAAARTIATVGPAVVEPERASYMIFAALAMLITIGLTAMFTAGIVEHLLSGRHVGLVGRRVLPQRGHVVVVGMGQVGVRLAAELKALGLGVVGIERDISAPNLVTARALGIPVHVGDAARRRVLRRVRADRAVALCAAGSDELDNVAVAVTARAVSPTLRVVLRAGNHDVIVETQSLFRIGTVCDVTGLTACYVVHSLLDQAPAAVFSQESGVVVVDEAGVRRREPQVVRDCGHPLEGR